VKGLVVPLIERAHRYPPPDGLTNASALIPPAYKVLIDKRPDPIVGGARLEHCQVETR
jgi:hypothetical protein